MNKCNQTDPTRKPVIQREYLLSKIRKGLSNATNVLSNVITCYTMKLRVIQCKNFYPMRKNVNPCKNRVIQDEKVLSSARNVLYDAIRDILQENQAEKNCHHEKKD